MEPVAVRAADPGSADSAACAEIYAPFVVDTAVSFETEPPDAAEMARRIAAAHLWLVATDAGGAVLGYAYGGSHRARPAYRWSVETSIYLADTARGRGIGSTLYRALLEELTTAGYANAYAGITLPNAASVALHERVGFRAIGTFPRVGRKFDRWHDVGWWHRPLS